MTRTNQDRNGRARAVGGCCADASIDNETTRSGDSSSGGEGGREAGIVTKGSAGSTGTGTDGSDRNVVASCSEPIHQSHARADAGSAVIRRQMSHTSATTNAP